MLSSVVLDLRLIGFEAAQSSSRCRRLGDPVAAANSFKLALTDDLHRHPDLPIIRSFCRAAHKAKGTGLGKKSGHCQVYFQKHVLKTQLDKTSSASRQVISHPHDERND